MDNSNGQKRDHDDTLGMSLGWYGHTVHLVIDFLIWPYLKRKGYHWEKVVIKLT